MYIYSADSGTNGTTAGTNATWVNVSVVNAKKK
jgi:hypothetical protein